MRRGCTRGSEGTHYRVETDPIAKREGLMSSDKNGHEYARPHFTRAGIPPNTESWWLVMIKRPMARVMATYIRRTSSLNSPLR